MFVDGPDHEKDYVQHADIRKRKRTKSLGYRVLVIKTLEDVMNISELKIFLIEFKQSHQYTEH